MKNNKNYDKLFSDNESKAEAFDKIAELYYDNNFGSTSKSDFEILMFSLYLDRILKLSESDMEAYSDYTLSKQLGTTQSKIRNLKIKKELKYPYDGFDWKESFARVSSTAQFFNGKIHIYISDPNLFIELKHFVELHGRTVDISLNPALFVVSIESFIELLLYVGTEDDEKKIIKSIRNTYQNEKIQIENFEKTSLVKSIKDNAGKVSGKVLLLGLKSSVDSLNEPVRTIVTNIIDLFTE